MTELARQPGFDFNEWSELAMNDPEAFESRRQEAIEQTIQTMPSDKQDRIRCLQWRIDQERKLATSPMAACIKLSNMMWESVTGEHGLLSNIKSMEKSQNQSVLSNHNNLLTFPSPS